MARGWHGNSDGHARAGQLGGKKSAENRRSIGRSQFGEQLTPIPKEAMEAPSATGRKQPEGEAQTE